jgi:hypothetical protein
MTVSVAAFLNLLPSNVTVEMSPLPKRERWPPIVAFERIRKTAATRQPGNPLYHANRDAAARMKS